MKIGFAYNIKDPSFKDSDAHAEYETQETIDAIEDVLAGMGRVICLPCDNTFPERLKDTAPDVVFNIAEGSGGRDRESQVPAICSMLGIPCSGSDAVILGLTMDKALTKMVARAADIRTTEFVVYMSLPDTPPPFGFPSFVKPAWDGSSRGVFRDSRVDDLEALRTKTASILTRYHQPALVEPYLDGRDFCVGLLGNDPPTMLKTCEVLLGHEDGIPFFSYEYKRRDTDRLDMNPRLSSAAIVEMEQSALHLRDILGCRDYVRIDFRTDADGTPYLLEVNALPGLSPVSGIIVRQAAASGLSYDETIRKILERSARSLGIYL